MGTELTLDVGTLYAFLLALARVSGMFIFVPLPGIKAGPEVARAVLALSLTLALASRWPVIDAPSVNIMLMTGWMLAEAGHGNRGRTRGGVSCRRLPDGRADHQLASRLHLCDHHRSDFGRRFGGAAHHRAAHRRVSSSSPPVWIVRFSWPSRRVFPPKCRAISRSRHPWSTA